MRRIEYRRGQVASLNGGNVKSGHFELVPTRRFGQPPQYLAQLDDFLAEKQLAVILYLYSHQFSANIIDYIENLAVYLAPADGSTSSSCGRSARQKGMEFATAFIGVSQGNANWSALSYMSRFTSPKIFARVLRPKRSQPNLFDLEV